MPAPTKRVRIGLWWYDIIVHDDLVPCDGVVRRGDTLVGQCTHLTRLIEVSSHALGEHWVNTIWHEAIHALNYQAEAGLSERQVSAIANGIEAILADNPDALRNPPEGESDMKLITAHELALAVSINLDNAAKGFDVQQNIDIARSTLEEIIRLT